MKDIYIAEPVTALANGISGREHISLILQTKTTSLYDELDRRFKAMKVKDHMNVIFKFKNSIQERQIVVSKQEMAHFSKES